MTTSAARAHLKRELVASLEHLHVQGSRREPNVELGHEKRQILHGQVAVVYH
jgi:hypothetical protein